MDMMPNVGRGSFFNIEGLVLSQAPTNTSFKDNIQPTAAAAAAYLEAAATNIAVFYNVFV
jgi:hypothetical protein